MTPTLTIPPPPVKRLVSFRVEEDVYAALVKLAAKSKISTGHAAAHLLSEKVREVMR